MSIKSPFWTLYSWIDVNKLNWYYLSKNPRAIQLLIKNPDKIDFSALAYNPNVNEIIHELINNNQNFCFNLNKDFLKLISLKSDNINFLNSIINQLDWSQLSLNPYAIKILNKNRDKINWSHLSLNPNAIEILEENCNKINWVYLSANPNAIKLLDENRDKINWFYLSKNPNAIKILDENRDKIVWNWFCLNTNPAAIKIIEENRDKIEWFLLLQNPNAIRIIKEEMRINPDNIDLYQLSRNPNCLNLLFEFNRDINIHFLCYNTNPEVLPILEKNKDKLKKADWYHLSENPIIFKLDCEKMKENNQDFYEELIKEVMHPSRVFKNPDYDYIEELFGD